MPIELILMDNVEKLGKIGESIRVSDGYARNYLIPNGLARKVTPGAMRQLEAKRETLRVIYEEQISSAQSMAEGVGKQSVSIPVQAAEDEKLYGSVTAQNISDAVKEIDIEVDRKDIMLEEPIKTLGRYPVELRLHEEVIATLTVWVVRADV